MRDAGNMVALPEIRDYFFDGLLPLEQMSAVFVVSLGDISPGTCGGGVCVGVRVSCRDPGVVESGRAPGVPKVVVSAVVRDPRRVICGGRRGVCRLLLDEEPPDRERQRDERDDTSADRERGRVPRGRERGGGLRCEKLLERDLCGERVTGSGTGVAVRAGS